MYQNYNMNELAFSLMAVNFRKYTAKIQNSNHPNNPKQKEIAETTFQC